MPPETGIVLFAGPSAHELPMGSLLVPGDRLQPPARRGDIERLVLGQPRPGVIVMCDGVFDHSPAVAHSELCFALDRGWRLWGASSLGAIRAWEMRHEGMHGFGYVYEQFARYDDFTDDELCVVHVPDPPYFPVTEALVNLRHALEHQGRRLGVTDAASEAVMAALKPLWFGDRTEAAIRAAMLGPAALPREVAEALLAWLRQHRIKTIDLFRLLQARPWAVPG